MSSQAQSLNLAIDLRVLGFTAGVSLLTAMLFGLIPAIGASRIDPQAVLRSGNQPDGGRLRAGLGRLLVAGQVAASLLLLVGAGLFVRTLINLRDIDLGLTRDTILATRVEPRGSNQKGPNFDRLRAQYDDLLTRVRALPGVRGASLASVTPLGVERNAARRRRHGRQRRGDVRAVAVAVTLCTCDQRNALAGAMGADLPGLLRHARRASARGP